MKLKHAEITLTSGQCRTWKTTWLVWLIWVSSSEQPQQSGVRLVHDFKYSTNQIFLLIWAGLWYYWAKKGRLLQFLQMDLEMFPIQGRFMTPTMNSGSQLVCTVFQRASSVKCRSNIWRGVFRRKITLCAILTHQFHFTAENYLLIVIFSLARAQLKQQQHKHYDEIGCENNENLQEQFKLEVCDFVGEIQGFCVLSLLPTQPSRQEQKCDHEEANVWKFFSSTFNNWKQNMKQPVPVTLVKHIRLVMVSPSENRRNGRVSAHLRWLLDVNIRSDLCFGASAWVLTLD